MKTEPAKNQRISGIALKAPYRSGVKAESESARISGIAGTGPYGPGVKAQSDVPATNVALIHDVDAFAAALAERLQVLSAQAVDDEPYWSAEQAAEHIACDKQRIYDLRSQGRLRCVKEGVASSPGERGSKRVRGGCVMAPAPKMIKTSVKGLYRRGKRYTVTFRDADGVQRKETVRTLAEARLLKAKRETEVSQAHSGLQAT